MNIFQTGSFTLNSGKTSPLKIECDALSDVDWATLALLASQEMSFREVHGVPTGGLVFADALRPYETGKLTDPILIADDVLTTGGSMERKKIELGKTYQSTPIIGVVAFARAICPHWILPIFSMNLRNP